MKKVIAAVGLTVLGMLLALAVLPKFGFEFGFMGDLRPKSTSYDVGEPFHAVRVQGGACDISINSAYDGQSQVYIRALGNMTRTVRVEDGVLTVSVGGNEGLFAKLGLGEDDRYINVYLPEDQIFPLEAESEGDIYLAYDLTFGDSTVKSGGDISIHAGVEGTLTVETDSGDIYISDVKAQAMTVRSRSGELALDTVTASGPTTLTTDSGDVWLWDCDGDSFTITTDSGDVSATFLSGKNFVASTGSGSMQVPTPDRSAGLCSVETGSGDIWLNVEEEDG